MNLHRVIEVPAGEHVSLDLLLDFCQPDALSLRWYLLDVEAIAKDKLLGRDVLAVEDEIRQSATGTSVEWEALRQMATQVRDLWQIILVGCAPGVTVARTASREELYQTCEIVVELVDSTEWLVFATSEVFQTKLMRGIPRAR